MTDKFDRIDKAQQALNGLYGSITQEQWSELSRRLADQTWKALRELDPPLDPTWMNGSFPSACARASAHWDDLRKTVFLEFAWNQMLKTDSCHIQNMVGSVMYEIANSLYDDDVRRVLVGVDEMDMFKRYGSRFAQLIRRYRAHRFR